VLFGKVFIEKTLIKNMKKILDYLAIPGGSKGDLKKSKKKRAVKEINKRPVDNIIILQGKDSEEDILYLGTILEKGDRIGFDTFPLHYKEYKVLIKKAIRDKKFPKGVKTENLKIPQDTKMWLYGVLGLNEEKLKKRKLNYLKNRHDNFYRKIKKIVHWFVKLD